MAKLPSAAIAHAETKKSEQAKACQELEIVAGLIRDAIADAKYNTSTGHYGRLNWYASDALTRLGYSVQDWGDATLISWEDICDTDACKEYIIQHLTDDIIFGKD